MHSWQLLSAWDWPGSSRSIQSFDVGSLEHVELRRSHKHLNNGVRLQGTVLSPASWHVSKPFEHTLASCSLQTVALRIDGPREVRVVDIAKCPWLLQGHKQRTTEQKEFQLNHRPWLGNVNGRLVVCPGNLKPPKTHESSTDELSEQAQPALRAHDVLPVSCKLLHADNTN